MSPHTQTPEERARRLDELLGIGRLLTSELHLDALLDRVLETARSLTGARFAAIGVLDGRRASLEQFLTSGLSAADRARIGELPHGRGVLGLLIDEPQSLRLHDVAQHPRSYGFPPGHPPMRSFLGSPITIRGEVWGNLYLTEKADGEDFDEGDVQTTEVLSQWAGIAIENAKLFGDSERRGQDLERALRGLEATIDVALALGDSTDLDRILGLIARRGRPLVGADELVIGVREGDALRLLARAGTHDEAHAELVDVSAPLAELLARARPVRIDELEPGSAGFSSSFGVPGARRALIVPVVFRGAPLGLLAAFGSVDRDPFTDDDERALRALAASAATAVTTARSVAADRLRSTIAAAESERKRWARELHDETLQGLGALKLALGAALRAPTAESQRASVETAVRQLDQEVEGLRAIIRDLRPAALDDLGLVPAIRTLAERLSERSGLVIVTRFEVGEARLPQDVETAAYRVTQEALNNVVKHASATRAEVIVRREPVHLTVSIVDDGVGLGGAEGTAGEGFGVTGMRERAELVGGAVSLRSQLGRTEVELTLPLL